MTEGSSGSRDDRGPRLERAIVLQLLRDDREQRWSCEELGAEIDAGAPAVEEAVRRLHDDGILCRAGQEVWASRAARRLDELGLIGI
jgi:DNA-binding Lrp family transcriptional regulator